CECCRGVPDPSRDAFGMKTLGHEDRCAAVAQIVEADMPQAYRLQSSLEDIAEVPETDRRSVEAGKHEIEILPVASRGESFLSLAPLVFSKALHDSRRQRHSPAASCRLGF